MGDFFSKAGGDLLGVGADARDLWSAMLFRKALAGLLPDSPLQQPQKQMAQ